MSVTENMSLNEVESVLSGTDKGNIQSLLLDILHNELEVLYPDDRTLLPSKGMQDARTLYDNDVELCQTPEGEDTFKQHLDQIGQEERNHYAHFTLLRGMVGEISDKIALANVEDDPENNPFHIESMVELQFQSGMTTREVENVFSNTVDHNVGTPHPTQYLTVHGIDLKRRGIGLSDLPEGQRAKNAVSWVKALVQEKHLALTEKATSIDSLDAEIEQAKINQAGRHQAYQRINNSYKNTWSQSLSGTDAPNIYGRTVRMKHAQLGWACGGDRDGKDPSERWSNLANNVTGTYERAQQFITILEKADHALRKNDFSALQASWNSNVERDDQNRRVLDERLQPLYNALIDVKKRLHHQADDGQETSLYKKTRQVVIDLARSQPEERAEMYMEQLPHFEKSRQQFKDLYVGLPYAGDEKDKDNGMGFYRFMYRQMEDLHDTIKDPEAKETLEEFIGLLKNEGMTVVLTEERNNAYESLEKAIDNLFAPQPGGFAETHIFPNDQRYNKKDIDALHGLGNDQKFTSLSKDVQMNILSTVSKHVSGEEIQAALFEANPFELNDSGYPAQNHELLELYTLRGDFPCKYAPKGVVAEAEALSPIYQLFITDAMDLGTIIPTPLAESYETMSELADTLSEASRTELYENNLEQRASYARQILENTETQTSRSLGSMVPCSDVIRQLGPLGKFLQYSVVQQLMETSINENLPSYDSWGCGRSSIARDMGDKMIPRRAKAQVALEHTDERGSFLDPNNPDDINILKSILYTSSTTQGKSNQEQFATASAYERVFTDEMSEKLGFYLQLTGRTPEAGFIPEPEHFSDNVNAFLEHIADKGMRHYSKMRDAIDPETDTQVCVRWSEKYSNIPGSSDTQKGDRPAGKGATKTFHNVRAIQSAVIAGLSRMRQDGHFTFGLYEQEKHEWLKEGKLTRSDLKEIEESPLCNYFENALALTEAARVDPLNGFRRNGLDKVWTFDKVMSNEIGYDDLVMNTDAQGNRNFSFEYDQEGGSVEAADVYQASLVADWIKFLAYTEAKHRSSNDVNFLSSAEEIINAIRPEDGSLNIEIGENTLKQNPHLQGVLDGAAVERPTVAMMDYYQERRNNGQEISTHDAALAAMAYRGNIQKPISPIINREIAYGRPHERDWNNVFSMLMSPDRTSTIDDPEPEG
ncbi:MAG: hypothetical protein ACRBDL_06010 [Alphaproteobacteria bacterium]